MNLFGKSKERFVCLAGKISRLAALPVGEQKKLNVLSRIFSRENSLRKSCRVITLKLTRLRKIDSLLL